MCDSDVAVKCGGGHDIERHIPSKKTSRNGLWSLWQAHKRPGQQVWRHSVVVKSCCQNKRLNDMNCGLTQTLRLSVRPITLIYMLQQRMHETMFKRFHLMKKNPTLKNQTKTNQWGYIQKLNSFFNFTHTEIIRWKFPLIK